jgi:hypothetical protein
VLSVDVGSKDTIIFLSINHPAMTSHDFWTTARANIFYFGLSIAPLEIFADLSTTTTSDFTQHKKQQKI